jgi:dihydropteroate synthase
MSRDNLDDLLTSAARPLVMGVVNITPDSFSDGGRFVRLDDVIAVAWAMVREGADILDIGGESTRPGSRAISVSEEMDRVLPVVEALRCRFDVPLSIDTGKAPVMRAAVAAGASMINDVYALRQPGALEAACDLGVPVCLVHMRGEPATMQDAPQYTDVLADVCDFLRERMEASEQAGIARRQLILDPGIGFGKQLAHNLTLLRNLPRITALGGPVLIGVSRKSMIGAVTGRPVGERLHGSVALAVYAFLKGAAILRVHDVGPTVDALRMIAAVEKG